MIGGLASSPSGQQVIEQTAQAGQQIDQAMQNCRTASQGQQATQRTINNPFSQNVNPYMPTEVGYYRISGIGMTPRAYGEYLSMSGKNKYNKRKAKHIAKMRS